MIQRIKILMFLAIVEGLVKFNVTGELIYKNAICNQFAIETSRTHFRIFNKLKSAVLQF